MTAQPVYVCNASSSDRSVSTSAVHPRRRSQSRSTKQWHRGTARQHHRTQVVRRLVQQQQVARVAQRLGEVDAVPLTAAQRADLLQLQVAEDVERSKVRSNVQLPITNLSRQSQCTRREAATPHPGCSSRCRKLQRRQCAALTKTTSDPMPTASMTVSLLLRSVRVCDT
jgi:hypothetical protein